MREYRRITQLFYNRLLDYVLNKIIENKDKKLALEFICGILEGDGSPSSRNRGHIIISTNDRDAKTLRRLLEIIELNFKIVKEKTSGKTYIRVNSLGILKIFDLLKDKIFHYYSRRRRKFIERFCNIGATKFILGRQKYTSSRVKSWLKREGILNNKYQLTSKGRKIRDDLLEIMKEVNVK
jgi:hypothetical protein